MNLSVDVKGSDAYFFLQVLNERRAQDLEFGGPEHDDGHDFLDWMKFIRYQLDATAMLQTANSSESPSTNSVEETQRRRENVLMFERRMIKIAALAMAAAQSTRRRAHL